MKNEEKKLLDKALDFIVETQEENDYICDQMVFKLKENYCENNCHNLNKECVKLFLEKLYNTNNENDNTRTKTRVRADTDSIMS